MLGYGFYRYCVNQNQRIMADDKTKKGPADSSRINVSEDYEIDYWTEALGVSKEKLKEAVQQAGASVTAVKEYLKK
jgi:hypothetical protein